MIYVFHELSEGFLIDPEYPRDQDSAEDFNSSAAWNSLLQFGFTNYMTWGSKMLNLSDLTW